MTKAVTFAQLLCTMTLVERKISAYKRKFDKELQQLKVQLMHQKHGLPSDQWLRLVYKTKRLVLERPDAYLTGELPDKEILIPSLDRVFKSFLQDQHIRDAQRRGVS